MDVLRISDIIKNSKADVVALQGLARNCTVHPNGATLTAEKSGVDQVTLRLGVGVCTCMCMCIGGGGQKWVCAQGRVLRNLVLFPGGL